MKKASKSAKKNRGLTVLSCSGALLSIILLILKQFKVPFLTNAGFNTGSALCAVLSVVFFLNRKTGEGILCTFSILVAEILQVIVIRKGFSSGLSGIITIFISTAAIAALGLLVSLCLRKSTQYYVFIPVAFFTLIVGFVIRMILYAYALLDAQLSFRDGISIISTSLSTVVFWVGIVILTILASLLKGPVEKKEEKAKPQKKAPKESAPEKQKEAAAVPEPAKSPEPSVTREKNGEFPSAVGGCSPKKAGSRYAAPDLSLLDTYETESVVGPGSEDSQAVAIADCLKEYGVEVSYLQSVCGPTLTRYEFSVGSGTQLNKITSREKELSYALCGKQIRILAPVPGKKAVGVEVPNDTRATVGFRNALENLKDTKKFKAANVPFILGMSIDGDYVFTDVAAMPHMIIAGTTGSGKSVSINVLLNSIIFSKTPEQVRLILVDPKYVELGMYEGLPHLLLPVITDNDKVLPMLEWLIDEMDRRYRLLSENRVRDIISMNSLIDDRHLPLEKLPYIVTVIDEVADLMASAGKDVDSAISRLAAKARAVGILLVLATQRPSADVITGTLKANLPGRIAFAVSSGVNSKIILDRQGAENLLGKGDMLFLDPTESDLKRLQGAFISSPEVSRVISKVAGPTKPIRAR